MANAVHPTNRRQAKTIRLVGKNLQQYDYYPDEASFFECTFTQDDKDDTTIVTAGKTHGTVNPLGGPPTYAVTCPSPVSIAKKTSFTLSIAWLGREDAVKIPFNGPAKADKLLFDMTWSRLATRAGDSHVILDVDGLDIDTDYTCKFTQADNDQISKSSDSEFVGDKGLRLDCGKQPTGFAISGKFAPIVFELYVKGSKTKASYAGPPGGGPIVGLDVCFSGKKDGDETDVDCGGLCGGCAANKKCNIDGDCANNIPCMDGICGLDGLTKATAAKTCKAAKIVLGDAAKNGFYWVTGPNGEFSEKSGQGPKRVMCWQEDRDGGGWTLAVKNWYGQHHSFAGSGRRQTGNINNGVMAKLGSYYKMDDYDIRVYLGQSDAKNDAFDAKASEMTIMRDHSSFYSYYSDGNKEYTIMKKYTARWYWYVLSRPSPSPLFQDGRRIGLTNLRFRYTSRCVLIDSLLDLIENLPCRRSRHFS